MPSDQESQVTHLGRLIGEIGAQIVRTGLPL
jgi:hypothetical protein